MKRQLSAPASIPPQKPEELLRNVVWLEGMDPEAVDFITSAAQIMVFDFGETITRQGEDVNGIYLIVSGMVKVDLPRVTIYLIVSGMLMVKVVLPPDTIYLILSGMLMVKVVLPPDTIYLIVSGMLMVKVVLPPDTIYLILSGMLMVKVVLPRKLST